MWRLWAEGKLSIVEMDQVTLHDVDRANRFWDAWIAATNESRPEPKSKPRKTR